MKLVGMFYFCGHVSPRTLGFLVIVPALLFIKDHEKEDKFSHVHGHAALLVKRSFPADQKGPYQARVDVSFLEDSGRKWHIPFLSVSSVLLAITDHTEKEPFSETLTSRNIMSSFIRLNIIHLLLRCSYPLALINHLS